MADRLNEDEDRPAWEQELIDKLREIVGSEDWLELPQRVSHEDYRIMERFCINQCEGAVQEELLSAIRGSGAFRRFKDQIHIHGIQEAWYAFRRDYLAEEAKSWLEANQIKFKP